MKYLWIPIAIVAVLAALVLLTAYICFHIAFYASRKEQPIPADGYDLPPGEIYTPYHATMRGWTDEVRTLPSRECTVTSFDGLKLRGKYYEYAPGAPLELMFHGYRGTAERDLCGGVQRCFALQRNVLIVDQRAAGKSEGHVISFGINESRDCRTWIDFAIREFGRDVRIILCGISMGAATVLIAAGRPLPENVVGVLADCGYSTAREIIQKTIKEMKLPPKLAYPFVKLGARIFGRFDLEETSPLEAMKTAQVPIIFFHGESDGFVPCEMSRINYEACSTEKRLVTVPGADHGMAYLVDPEGYLAALREFFK